MSKIHACLAAAALCAACSSPTTPSEAPAAPRAPRAWDAPPISQQLSARDGKTGQRLGLGELLERLAAADVVFAGETHDDETTHRAELWLYEGLRERRQDQVVLALEMFERDVQPALDAYLRREIGEADFLARARPWGNYATAYR